MATIEPVFWVIRLGEHTKKSGDDFKGVCYAVKAGLTTLRIAGMLSIEEKSKFIKELFKLRPQLIALGFNKVIYERVTDEGFKTETINLKKGELD